MNQSINSLEEMPTDDYRQLRSSTTDDYRQLRSTTTDDNTPIQQPYLFNTLGFFVASQTGELYDAASTVYAFDIGTIYGILALFTNILATEERKLVAPDLLRKYKHTRDLEIVVAIIFLLSAIPQFWTLNLRYYIWATTFFVYRGGSMMRGLRKQSNTV